MQFIIRNCAALLVITTTCHSIVLPCDFTFKHKDGYNCRVVNFTNSNQFDYITDVIGDHLSQAGRSRTNKNVVRMTMWNATVEYLPGNLTEWFPHLKVLLVKKCGMKNLTRGQELNGLRKIYFGFNKINEIPVDYFWHSCKLEILSLHGNNISEVPEMAFRDLISLQRLSLASNRLEQLNPQVFVNCLSLLYVDLDDNLLSHIDEQLFYNQSQLTRVFLRHNHIRSIGNEFLSNLPQLKFALFQNNLCIDESFPETPFNKLQSVFKENCSPKREITTTTPKPIKNAPRSKPKYQNQSHKIYLFDQCTWKTPKGHRYF